VNERELIRSQVSRIAGGRPTRWTDERTSLGDFDGREWTLEIFDVPVSESRALHARLWGLKKRVWKHLGHAMTTIFHTPEDTERFYPWVRSEEAPTLVDSGQPSVPRVSVALLGQRLDRDAIPLGMRTPKVAA
jgi:hypothetical protein